MQCPNKVVYVIRKGDNLYQLSKYFQTTVPRILALNPNIDPYNLEIGSSITICPGENFVVQRSRSNPVVCPKFGKQIELNNEMREAWEQHVYWTRMLIISICEKLADQQATTDRLLENPKDIADIFAKYYSLDVAKQIEDLLTEHLKIGAELITALRDGKTQEAEQLDRQWYANADAMAQAFSSINPYFDQGEMTNMLYDHLDITKKEVAQRLAKNYPEDIDAFDSAEEQAIAMADQFTAGIMQQFPQKFV